MTHEPYAWIERDYNSILDTLRAKAHTSETLFRVALGQGPEALTRCLEGLAGKLYTAIKESGSEREAKAIALACAHTAMQVILSLDREGGPTNVWESDSAR